MCARISMGKHVGLPYIPPFGIESLPVAVRRFANRPMFIGDLVGP